MTSQEVHDILQANAARLRACAVNDVALFGSVSLNEHKLESA